MTSPLPCLPIRPDFLRTDHDVTWGGGYRGVPTIPPPTVRGVLRQRFVGGLGQPGQA